MKIFKIIYLIVPALLFHFSADAQVAIKGETVYTMAGSPISNGVVLVKDGEIERVGSASSVNIPSDYEVYEAKVVTPGLIDAHSVVGLAGYMNQPHDQDQLETSSAIQPELRAIDAYNAREELVKHLRNFGITTVHTGHGPGALISGQTMIVKTTGETINEALVDSVTMLAFTLGNMHRDINRPGNRSKGIAMLRQELIKAQSYAEKRKSDDKPNKDLGMEALADLLDGKIKALITAHTAVDILAALRLQEEFDFPLVLDGASEAYLVLDEIKKAAIPVIVHPTMIRPSGGSRNASMETAAKLYEAGIPIAFQSGYESYVPKTRVVLFEAGVAAANGLGKQAALEVLTMDAAKLLGIADRVGSLEAGKDADIALYDGDPLEYITQVVTVFINGEKVN